LPQNSTFCLRPHIAHFPVKERSAILDVGSYLGANLIHYAMSGHTVTGLEPGAPYRENCEENCLALEEATRDRITVYPDLIEEFETDERFDHIVCTDILKHVVDPGYVVWRCAELLKEGGTLFLAEIKKRCTTHVRDVSLLVLEVYVLQAGLIPRSFSDDSYWYAIGERAEKG
jgi:2-polyprenyl-3-methyl-5-hydroxy-6-metoxy-1,4-benzoquinol methylase